MVTWSCQSLVQVDRLANTSHLFEQVPIVLLVGTRLQAEPEGVSYRTIGRRYWILLGYGRGKHTNKHCGLAVGLHLQFFKLKTCHQNPCSPKTHAR